MPTENAIATTKAALRRQMAERCRRLVAESGRAAAVALAGHAMAALPDPAGRRIAGYLPLADEIDPRPLLAALQARGALLFLPCVEEGDAALVFRRWEPGDPLLRGVCGNWEPAPDAPTGTPEWIFLPLRAFDRTGRRLGRGGGYYDRTMARLRSEGRWLVGLAFADQEVDRVPEEPHDERLDAVLTERGLITAAQE